jgi:hypothetical protein
MTLYSRIDVDKQVYNMEMGEREMYVPSCLACN